MKGRKPVPTAIKKARGNPGKRPLNDQEPQIEAGIPEDPPAHIKGEAADAWRQLSPILNNVKVLTPMDVVAFEMLCVTVGNYRKAAAKVADTSIIVLGKNGGAMQNPWFAPMNRCLEQLRGLLAEFGMTPAERSRLKVKGGDGEESPWEDF